MSDKERNKFNVMGLMIIFTVICALIVMWPSNDHAPIANASEVSVIVVPENFGKTVGIAKSESYGYVSILFENGVLYTFVEQGTAYHIVWEES